MASKRSVDTTRKAFFGALARRSGAVAGAPCPPAAAGATRGKRRAREMNMGRAPAVEGSLLDVDDELVVDKDRQVVFIVTGQVGAQELAGLAQVGGAAEGLILEDP